MKLTMKKRRTAAEVIAAARAELESISDAATTKAQAIDDEMDALMERARGHRRESLRALGAAEALIGRENL